MSNQSQNRGGVIFAEEHTSTLEDELNELLSSVCDEPEVDNDFKSLNPEFAAFARTGVRTKLKKTLLTNWYCSKIRFCLSDKSLSASVRKFFRRLHAPVSKFLKLLFKRILNEKK